MRSHLPPKEGKVKGSESVPSRNGQGLYEPQARRTGQDGRPASLGEAADVGTGWRGGEAGVDSPPTPHGNRGQKFPAAPGRGAGDAKARAPAGREAAGLSAAEDAGGCPLGSQEET